MSCFLLKTEASTFAGQARKRACLTIFERYVPHITNRLPQCGYPTDASPHLTGWRPWTREPVTGNSRTAATGRALCDKNFIAPPMVSLQFVPLE